MGTHVMINDAFNRGFKRWDITYPIDNTGARYWAHTAHPLLKQAYAAGLTEVAWTFRRARV